MKLKPVRLVIALFGICLFILSSCNPDRVEVKDQKQIKNYLEDNNLQAESTSTGLHYIITIPGNTEHPTPSDTVQIAYTGKLLNGDIFDFSPSATFILGDLIDGMVEGLQLFGKGGEGILIIPSELGYGGNSQPGIPANSVLVFDVKLIDF